MSENPGSTRQWLFGSLVSACVIGAASLDRFLVDEIDGAKP
jgi:hypothetical protein